MIIRTEIKGRDELCNYRQVFKMPHLDRKANRQDRLTKTRARACDKELHDLKRLLSFITTQISKQQGPIVSQSKACKSQNTSVADSSGKGMRYMCTEATELDRFSVTYKNERCFSDHPHQKHFLDIFTSLMRNRLTHSNWLDHSSSENILRVLTCLRLMIREPCFQKSFHELNGFGHLSKYMETITTKYLGCEEQTLAVEQLVTITYMFQKLSAVEEQRNWVIECSAHKCLAKLLSTRDSSVLLGALLALTTLAESSDCKEKIGELSIVDNLLVILQEYDLLSKRMSAELLRLLCPVQQVREELRVYEGIPVLLSLLYEEHVKLLWSVVWVLVQLCQDPDISSEIRAWGGVQQLLRILHVERVYVSDRSSMETLSSANAAGRIQRQHVSEELSPLEIMDNIMTLQAACCAAITELVLDDTTAHHVVQENGIYIIGRLVLPQGTYTGPKAKSLQCYAFRTLRFLFSMERNRHLFKRIFSTELFEMFIDVGHYVRNITAYEALQERVALLSSEELDSLKENIEAINQNRAPLRVINGYAILDHLGSGAFGSVFKVRKQSGQNIMALKEVNLHNPAFGKDKKARDSNVEKIVSELTIVKEQMAHPNIVKYFKTFIECDRLYIVMELIEGAPLAEYFSSLKEKQQQFTEGRVWNIFIQMCLALRYLHKEKRIIHRDLTPNNIMLGEKDKVTITDFGLAKQKQENSKLMSVVGTILYCCPEIVKSEPYGERADVWAIGCVLYQMVTLNPPFYSTNMLSLATKIVEAVYEPVEGGTYTERITDMIKWCLTPDAERRPDIVEVSAKISDIMMKHIDSLCTSQNALERRAERDRKRAQKYFLESKQVRQGICPSSVSQVICSEGHNHVSKGTPKGGPDPGSASTLSSWMGQATSQYAGSDDDPDAPETVTPIPGQPDQKRPLAKQSVSISVAEEPNLAGGDSLKQKVRPASAGIFVSQRKVRQIDDPIQRLLGLLHKIIYVTQLPPATHHDHRRRTIERFKKSLFQYGSNPFNLKVELNKVLQGSLEHMESAFANTNSLANSFGRDPCTATKHGESAYVNLPAGITYEQIQSLIEEVLEETDYYEGALSRGDLNKSSGPKRLPPP